MVDGEHAQVSSVVTTRIQKFLAPPPTSIPSERLQYSWCIRSDHRCGGKCRDIDLLEVQQPPVGRMTFQLVV